jgi:hypothetical protein
MVENPGQKPETEQAQMTKLKCQMNVKIQMTNQKARPGQVQMTNKAQMP